jgi:TRAP-type C4-dicarboxylate transport system permease small subunit
MSPTFQADYLSALYDRLIRLLVFLSAIALCGMAAMIFIDVILRYFFNAPLPASVEMSQLIEPWVIFLPFAYTLAVGGHVQVTLVTMRLSKRWQRVCDLFAYGVDFLFFLVLCYYSFREFAHSFAIGEIMMAPIRLRWWLGKMAMPIGMFFIALQCVFQILAIRKRIQERG